MRDYNVTHAMALASGTKLGPYEILALLGAGDVTADGQRFLVETPYGDSKAGPPTVILNWTAVLKK